MPHQVAPQPQPQESAGAAPAPDPRPAHWLRRYPWLPYVLPLAVYLFTGWLGADRTPDPAVDESRVDVIRQNLPAGSGNGLEPVAPPPRRGYALAYALQIAATLGAMIVVAPVYWSVPWRLSGWAVVWGVVGVAAWILICRGELEARLLAAIGLADWADFAARPAYNPLAAFHDSPTLLVVFLVMRFAGLVLLVPLIEEFFLRGFLMRFFVQADWWTIPLGQVTWTAAIVATAYGVLAHPAEMIAAAVWFSLITLLYARTRNLWDCVVAHAVTNGLLGVYILLSQDWTLW